ncbi:MAG: peptide chain release factor N(5)-glutamine methyltransferase [Patescibacteria group bacterium]|nr:peptide chain release factor N(5)-glutamine methyltransferase [Patescibacteria group bacterium]MDD4611013.1 peptide chain release factor N(5)-glutamine methyltransferase [Patescibacteria group bacterium]
MTAKETLINAVLKLNNTKIKNPHYEAEILLSHILNKPREYILTHSEKKLSLKQISKFNRLVKKRSKGEPTAYLIGYKYFYGNKYLVNKNVLIPRPETELLIDETAHLASHISRRLNLIDIGTGSGNIIISLAKKFSSGHPKISFNFFGLDISLNALRIAKQNAKLNKVQNKIKFIQGNLLKPILDNPKYLNNSKNPNDLIIIANLPYLTPEQIKKSASIKYEPKLALQAGSDGLKYYYKLFQQIKKLQSLYAVRYILCEIDPGQNTKIKKLIKKELPHAKLKIKKDLAGLNRLVILEF